MRYLFLSLALLFSLCAAASTRIIAHRGYWRAEGAAQNSISSLQNASQIGCFGSETDVWITRDGTVMVNHDATFQGVRLETATTEEARKLTLKNGETMPTLEEYLNTAKKGSAQLIIEIKSHKDILRQNACIDATIDLVKKAKMKKKVTYIAFSWDAVTRLIAKAPRGTEVYYLEGDKTPEQLKAAGCAGPDYEQSVLREKHPEWIAECKRLGLKVNVWTVDTDDNLKYFIGQDVDYITTNEPVKAMALVKERNK